ncbi:MAG: glycoside hydrolase family 127 protein [Rubrobacteraceae bacterium]
MLDSTQRPSVVVDTSRSPHSRLKSLPLTDVRLLDGLWEPRRRINRKVTLPSQYDFLESTGRLDNFRRASGKLDAPFQGIYFNDSDVYKWLEAASWELAAGSDPELERMVDVAISEVEDAQQPDGYLNTYFMFDKASERWTNLRDMHELYCAGHLIQAAVAHHCATGNKRLLDVARKLADHTCEVLGPEEHGKKEGIGGHEEIEMALVELYRDTGEYRYLEQARYFLDARGRGLIGGGEYHQDHKLFHDQDEAVGHAVRAVYLYAGAADAYAETGDEEVLRALERLWDNMTTRRMYVSGGIGSRYDEESFGRDFELPSARAYAESCAAIGSVMWNWRMLMLDGDARYADLMEHTLYNAVLPGLSLDGQNYFYQNPLTDDGEHRRQPWFGCACCPPNIARLLVSLPGYFHGVSDESVWVHLYAEGEAEIHLNEKRVIKVRQRTSYPWDGNVEVEVNGEGEFALMLRIPSWCETGAGIEVNGEPFDGSVSPGSYAEVRCAWRPGDTVRVTLPMPVRRVESHPYVTENAGRVALMRGPLLYCVEQADNPALNLRDLVLTAGEDFLDHFRPDLLGGVSVLEGHARTEAPDEEWDGRLYRTDQAHADVQQDDATRITAVPYYAWANREPGAMQVWLRSR